MDPEAGEYLEDAASSAQEAASLLFAALEILVDDSRYEALTTELMSYQKKLNSIGMRLEELSPPSYYRRAA